MQTVLRVQPQTQWNLDPGGVPFTGIHKRQPSFSSIKVISFELCSFFTFTVKLVSGLLPSLCRKKLPEHISSSLNLFFRLTSVTFN